MVDQGEAEKRIVQDRAEDDGAVDPPEEERRALQGQEPEEESDPEAVDEEVTGEVSGTPARPVPGDDADGASRTRSATAPASAGKPVGDHRGELDPPHSPDLRPRDTQGAGSAGHRDETAVPGTTGSTTGRSASAGSASSLAGSGGTERDPAQDARRGEDGAEEESREDDG
jgi:hypothetical protein